MLDLVLEGPLKNFVMYFGFGFSVSFSWDEPLFSLKHKLSVFPDDFT